MATSVLRSSVVPLQLGPVTIGGAPAVQRFLAFALQHQNQTNWCWAAVTSSIAGYFKNQGWPQCRVVNGGLGQTNCCANGSSQQCNAPWYLDKALTNVGNFANYVANPLPMAAVRAEIDAGRPIGVRIGWAAGGGHFVTITGYSGQSVLDIQDPWFGHSSQDFNEFSVRYLGGGKWTDSYATKARGAPNVASTSSSSGQCICLGCRGH